MSSTDSSVEETFVTPNELYTQFFVEGKPLCLIRDKLRCYPNTYVLAVAVDGPHLIRRTTIRSPWLVYPPHFVVAWGSGSYYMICEIKVVDNKLQYRVTRVLSPDVHPSYESKRQVGEWRDTLATAMNFHGYSSNFQNTGLNVPALRFLLRRAMAPKMSKMELTQVESIKDTSFRVVNDDVAAWLSEDPVVKAVRDRQFGRSAPTQSASAPSSSAPAVSPTAPAAALQMPSWPIPAVGGGGVAYPGMPLPSIYYPMFPPSYPMMPWMGMPYPFNPIAGTKLSQMMLSGSNASPTNVQQEEKDGDIQVAQPAVVQPASDAQVQPEPDTQTEVDDDDIVTEPEIDKPAEDTQTEVDDDDDDIVTEPDDQTQPANETKDQAEPEIAQADQAQPEITQPAAACKARISFSLQPVPHVLFEWFGPSGLEISTMHKIREKTGPFQLVVDGARRIGAETQPTSTTTDGDVAAETSSKRPRTSQYDLEFM